GGRPRPRRPGCRGGRCGAVRRRVRRYILRESCRACSSPICVSRSTSPGALRFRLVQEELGGGFDDRVHVEAVSAVEVWEASGLAKAFDPERTDAVTAHAAEP